MQNTLDPPTGGCNTLLPAATDVRQDVYGYISAGIPVFPIHPRSKEPATPKGFYNATTDPGILQLFNPNSNVGIPTGCWRAADGSPAGGLVVVDVDGDEGLSSLQQWLTDGTLSPDIFEQTLVSSSNRTDRKSIAIWFLHPLDIKVGCSVSKVANKIDIRGDGGYQVVPPSVHPTGSTYTWLNRDLIFGKIAAGQLKQPFAHIPAKLLAKLSTTTGPARKIIADMPSEERISDLLDGPEGGRTEWYKRAKRKLKGREYYPNLFEGKLLAEEGERNSSIQRMAGQVVSMLFNEPGSTPELCFALCYDTLQQVAVRAGEDPDEDFIATGWQAILKYWAREEEKVEQKAVAIAKEQEEAKSILQTILDGAKSWCEDDVLHGRVTKDEEGNTLTPLTWLAKNLVLYMNNAYFVMNRYGYYCKHPVSDKQLITKIKEQHLDKLISLKKVSEKGVESDLTNQDIINRYSTQIHKVEGVVNRETRGAWLATAGVNKTERILKLPLFHRRNDLTPVYNPYVDAWLRHFFGEHYTIGIYWIACALAFEEGAICALSLVGDPACGKKLFVQGLAECLTSETYADDTALTDEYRPFLLDTGILSIDEGLPGVSKRSIPDIFRRYTSGEAINVNAKWKPQIIIHNPLRIVMTANNHDILEGLTGGKHISKSDKQALCQRILHIDIPKDCSTWLESQGGYNYTKGWVHGEGGSGSDYTLAKHFLWLYEQLREEGFNHDSRFLVMGNLHKREDLQLNLTTRTDIAALIVEVLIRSIEECNGVVFEDGVWATPSGILEYFRMGMSKKSRKELDVGVISKALRHLTLTTETGLKGGKYADWHKLNLKILLTEASTFGYPCEKLLELCTES